MGNDASERPGGQAHSDGPEGCKRYGARDVGQPARGPDGGVVFMLVNVKRDEEEKKTKHTTCLADENNGSCCWTASVGFGGSCVCCGARERGGGWGGERLY